MWAAKQLLKKDGINKPSDEQIRKKYYDIMQQVIMNQNQESVDAASNIFRANPDNKGMLSELSSYIFGKKKEEVPKKYLTGLKDERNIATRVSDTFTGKDPRLYEYYKEQQSQLDAEKRRREELRKQEKARLDAEKRRRENLRNKTLALEIEKDKEREIELQNKYTPYIDRSIAFSVFPDPMKQTFYSVNALVTATMLEEININKEKLRLKIEPDILKAEKKK